MKKHTVIAGLVLATIPFGFDVALAQGQPAAVPVNEPIALLVDSIELNRAKNYARQKAEQINGGLGRYRAEAAMHGPALEAPFIDNGDGTVTFHFYGGPPAWTTPTTKSVITVGLDRWLIQVNYNGPARR